MELPKLKKVSEVKKKKIILLSDDLRMSSGVGTMSREIVMGTIKEYDWVQVAGAIKHPDAGKAVDMCEERQDTFLVFDNGLYGTGVTEATSQAEGFNTNYAATYYPWVQINDAENKLRWIPPSAAVAEAYAFNDKVANPWFAPAGINRGGMGQVVRAERKLTQSNRDEMYDSNLNPIATL